MHIGQQTKLLGKKIFSVLAACVLLCESLAPAMAYADAASSNATSSGSTTQAQSNSTAAPSVSNTNTDTTTNTQTTQANTGGNSIITPTSAPTITGAGTSPTPSPSTSPTPSGTPTQTQAPSPTATETPTPTTTPDVSASDATASATPTPTPGISEATGSASIAQNSNTGAASSNSAHSSESNSTSTINTNSSSVTNTASSTASTGGNTASGSGTTIQTGSASAQLNLANIVNTNLTGHDFWQAIINIFSTSSNDIDLTKLESINHFDPSLISALAENKNTGDGSINIALATILSAYSVYNQNAATLTTTMSATASTGTNTATASGSIVKTGDATASANMFNLVNTNVTGGNWFFGVINLFQKENGNIILPYELQFLNGPEASGSAHASAQNSDTGLGSQNSATASAVNSLTVTNTNSATVTNTTDAAANTGNNHILGSGTVTTGQATAVANLFNIINSNITGSRWLLLVINNAGNWQGNLVGWWGNTITIGKTTYAWVQLPHDDPLTEGTSTAINQETGVHAASESYSTNTTNASVSNTNQATVANILSASADTGNNNATGNSSQIQTGSAQASTNAVNIVNTNIFGNNWFLGIVNIFDSFFGDIIFPRPDLSLTKTVDKTNAKPGDTLTYSITYANTGRLWAKQTTITDKLPAGTTFISADHHAEFASGTVTWNLADEIPFGKIWPGQHGTVTLQVRIDDGLACNTTVSNTATVATMTDEPNKTNNTASAATVVNADSCTSVTPTPQPTPGSGGNNENGSNNGGSGGGIGGTSVCGDTEPGAPTLISVTQHGPNSVTLTWTKAKDPVSYYLVAYGTNSGVYQFGNPNVGGPDTTSYTVNNLSGGVTYYFVVRAGNGCKPGPFSNERFASATGGTISGPAAGFAPGVLGLSTEDGPAADTSILGSQETNVGSEALFKGDCSKCIWWPLLLLETILLGLYFSSTSYLKGKRPLLISVALPILTYLFFLFINRTCLAGSWFTPSGFWYCRYFWLLDGLVFAVFVIARNKAFRKKSK